MEITGSGACSASGMEARQGESPAISRDFSEADSPIPGGETPNLASCKFASCWFDHKHEEFRKHGGEREGARTQGALPDCHRCKRGANGNQIVLSIQVELPRLSELPLRFPLQSNRMPDGQLATLLSAAFSVLHTDDSGSDGGEFSHDYGSSAMPRRPAKVTQADIARAIRAAKEAGASAVTVDGDGVIRIALTASAAPIKPTNDSRSGMDAIRGVEAFPETHRKRVKRTLYN